MCIPSEYYLKVIHVSASSMWKETYPDVCIQTADAACNEAEVVPGNHFLPVEENVWKKGLNAFRDHGLYAALEKFAGAGTHTHTP